LGKYVSYGFTTFKNIQVYKLDIIFKVIGSILTVLATREIWISIYSSNSSLVTDTGVSIDEMATYAMMSIVVSSFFGYTVAYDISAKVRTGEIILELQKPWNFQLMYLAKALGNSFYNLIYIIIPTFLTLIIIFSVNIPNGWQAIFFIISLLLSFIIIFSINFSVGLLSFMFTEIWGFEFIKIVLVDLCSGFIVPLWLFPQSISAILYYLPFRGIYDVPLSIFIGKETGESILSSLLFQGFWAALLFLIVFILMKSMERLLVSTGG
jgi:ABC-2 type transport system permease protein